MMALNLAVKEFKLLIREKGTFFWLVILPILFMVLFGAVFSSVSNNVMTVPYINLDNTSASQTFIKEVGTAGGFKLKSEPTTSLQQQISKINNGKQSLVLVIPKGFGSSLQSQSVQAKVEVYHDASSTSSVAPVMASINSVAVRYQQANIQHALQSAGVSATGQRQALTPPIKIVSHAEHAASYDVITQIVPGYTVMFVFFVIISMVRRFIRDKETGMIARLRSTRMRATDYLLGMWLPYIVITLIQCAILLTFGHLVYGVHLGNLLSIAAVVLVLSLCSTAFGLGLSMLVQSENQGIGITQLITLGGAALGGLWFPIDLMPHFVQVMGHFTPQFWAQQGLQNIMLRGSGFVQVWPNLLMLLGFSALGLAVALVRYRGFIRTAS